MPPLSTLDDELTLLLAEPGGLLPAPPRASWERLLGGVDALERFSPFTPQVARALKVEFHTARRALHTLSDEQGWIEVPILPDLRIRPVWVNSGGNPREVDGAVFARIAPGGRIPAHHHHGPEVMVVLQGCLQDLGRPDLGILPAGGVLESADKSEHELLVPLDPAVVCLCLVVNEGWVEYLL